MKTINQKINEGRQVDFRVQFNIYGADELPINATILVEERDKNIFLKYLKTEIGNTFLHAEDWKGTPIE